MAADDQHAHIFQFDFDPRYRWAATPFGIVGRSFIRLTGEEFFARFGPWCVRTPRANIASCAISGPFNFVKTAGPAHLSLADRGLTFATNSRQGVCIGFRTPVRGIDPLGLIRHPNLTVTPADPAALARALDLR